MTTEQRTTLDQSLVSGLAWTAAMRWLAQVISWVATLIAARILAPGDYGIASMAMLAIGLVRMIEDFGLDAVLVQDRSIIGERQARLAGFILTIGCAMGAGFVVLSPAIADFFREPDVAAAVAVLALLCLTDALQVIPRAGLQRDLQFRKLALAHLIQTLVTQSALLALALAGAGFWAVVINTVVGGAAVAVLLVLWHPYRVRWPKDFSSYARPLLQGWRVMASRIAWYGYTNADQAIIGRTLGKDPLGAYSFATTFANIPLAEIGSVVGRVVPGVFSEIQNRRDELRRYFLVLTELLSYVALPAAVGLGLTADLFVHIVLGSQWGAVVAPLQILCIYVAFQASQTLVSHVLMWTGQYRPVMWFTIVAAVALWLSMLLGVRYGLSGVAWVWAVAYPVVNVPTIVLAFRTIDISLLDWLRALWPAAAACAAMTASVVATRAAMSDEVAIVVRFALSVGVGAIVYAAVLWFGFRRRCLAVWGLLKRVSHAGPVPTPG